MAGTGMLPTRPVDLVHRPDACRRRGFISLVGQVATYRMELVCACRRAIASS